MPTRQQTQEEEEEEEEEETMGGWVGGWVCSNEGNREREKDTLTYVAASCCTAPQDKRNSGQVAAFLDRTLLAHKQLTALVPEHNNRRSTPGFWGWSGYLI